MIDRPAGLGFFYCNITAPEHLEHPIIQTHIKTQDGIRTISPLGTWNDMIFSEEMYNAMKIGYKFEIKGGYLFESDFVFDNIIEDLYKLRLEYPKSDPMNYVAKILMNSLYGRFGMDDNFIYCEIIPKKEYDKYEEKFNDSIIDITDLDDNYLVELKNPKVALDTELDNASEIHNINVAIASAITAYSRIHMSIFKNNPNFNLYYSDTDSAYIDKELDQSLVSNSEIGKMKLERVCDKAVFLAPKVYGLLSDGKETIKVKGLTKEGMNNINIEKLELLLIKDHLFELNQEKWFKSLSTASITITEQMYTLK